MNHARGAAGRAADRMMGLDSAAYGDERERAVFMEAATYGFTITTYVTLAVAFVAAVLGGLLLPVVLLALAGVPSWSTIWYARRRGVDVGELALRAERGRQWTVGAVVLGGFALVLAAMAFTVFVGHGVVPVPELDVAGDGASGPLASVVRGAVVGGAGGCLVAAVLMAVKVRQAGVGGHPVDDAAEED